MPLSLGNAPLPNGDPIARPFRQEFLDKTQADPLDGFLTDIWLDYLNRLIGQVNASPFVKNSVSVSAQTASIAATDFSGGALTEGLYRLSYYARITQAAGVSSSLTVTFSWTESGVALAVSGAAMTGNTITTVQSGSVLVKIDAATPVRYATTYASAGAPAMTYRLIPIIEQVQA